MEREIADKTVTDGMERRIQHVDKTDNMDITTPVTVTS